MCQIDTQHPLNVCRASAGTGKTFTLAACYVGLLLSGESYRNILAVTFTNKATAEMKERILTYLYAIANGDQNEDAFFEKAKSFMIARQTDDDTCLRQRAQECFAQMLSDYDNVRVSTIDSFLQTLLSGMAQMLGKGAGYSTELNLKQVITNAVDKILTTEMDSHEGLKSIMAEYMTEQMQQEAKWDLRQSIIALAMNLYDESVQMLAADDQIVLDPKQILAYKKSIDGWQKYEKVVRLKEVLGQVQQHLDTSQTPIPDAVISMVENINSSLGKGEKKIEIKDYFRGLTASKWKEMNESKPDVWKKKLGDSLYSKVLDLQELCIACRKIYLEWRLTSAYLMDMRMMQGLFTQIQRDLRENNRMLLAETASTLRSALKPGDADFILEKAGIRYKHIMIDEFQDTSRLQWGVFLPLLQDLLSAVGHTLLIVGDIKQSIYRWRNGDWHIMNDLGTTKETFSSQYNQKFRPLVKNFRSRQNIVRFNLRTMQKVLSLSDKDKEFQFLYDEGYNETNLTDYYNEKNEGGYVRMRIFPTHNRTQKPKTLSEQELNKTRVQNDVLRDMFDTMEDLLKQGEHPSDMMILVRINKEAQSVIKFFDTLSKEKYPFLCGTRIVSGDSFRLDQSPSVRLAIKALAYIESGDEVAAKYIELATGNRDKLALLDAINRQSSLYETLQTIVRLLKCDEEGRFTAEDIAYVNCLMDKVHDYVATNGSNRKAFLRYWDDIMHSNAIPASDSNSIRIMTIHSSKGLESKTLFIPFCTWDMESNGKNLLWCETCLLPKDGNTESLRQIPIIDSALMAETDYAPVYEAEHKDQRIDNLNLLYVALTRAADTLYIYIEQKITKQPIGDDNVGALLIRAYEMEKALLEADKAYSDAEAMCYVEYSEGTDPHIHRRQGGKKEEIFGFSDTEELSASLRSDSGQVRFRQSQESAIYATFRAKAEEILEHINVGNICHDILSRTEKREDIELIVNEFYGRGIIGSTQQMDYISELINGAWSEPLMCDWFSGNWQLLREQAILTADGEECRPDRVMIKGQTAVVLDYKFGEPQEKYAKQVHRYMEAMHELGYKEVSGYLWYANSKKLEKVL